MATAPGMYRSILQGIGAPVTPATVRDLSAWQRAEGGSAGFNPFNTTQSAPGATNYNSVGVRNYGSAQAGTAATIKTLTNGRYAPIIANLRQGGRNTAGFASAVGSSPWGTSGKLVASILGSPYQQTNPVAPSTAPHGASLGNPSHVTQSADNVRGALANFFFKNSQDLMTNGTVSPDGGNIFNLIKALSKTDSPLGAPAGGTLAPKTRSLLGMNVVKTARTQLGQPYQWGGTAALGQHTDCSGLVQAVMGANGVKVPRTTYEQWKAGTPVDLNHIQQGDALYFHMGPNGPEHVGLYIGDGKMIEDPHTGDVVKIQSLSNYDQPVGARRFS